MIAASACTSATLIDLFCLLLLAALPSHHITVTKIDQLYLVLVPVLHTCASAAAPRALERAYRRHGVQVLHTWASGIVGWDARARAIHMYKSRVRNHRKRKKKKRKKEKRKKTGDGRRHITGSGSGSGTGTDARPRWREGAICEVLA